MKTLNIYLAAQAVMYLPIYLAKEKGIFSTLLSDTKVNLCPVNGDHEAIEKMNDDNESVDSDTFAIAIADPNAIRDITEARIIGALIDRLSFWGVSKGRTNCNRTGVTNRYFKKIVHYADNYITCYNIGIAVRTTEKINNFATIEKLGDEFVNIEEKTIIISPDLLTIAKLCVENKIFINYHFASADRYMANTYITTAIITSKWCLAKDSEESKKLIRVIEAIQKAKSILYSSKQIAREILLNMDCIKNMKDVDEEKKTDIANYIIKIINEDRIYPSDLNITEEQWKSTNTNSDIKYSIVIFNDIVLEAEKIIANQFGITLMETFADGVSNIKRPYLEEIETLKTINKELNATISNLNTLVAKLKNTLTNRLLIWLDNNWFKLLLLLSIVYIIIYCFCNFVFRQDWTNSEIAEFFAMTFAAPIIVGCILEYKKRKKNRK